MIYGNIYQDIISSFGALWKYKERGKTIEIITPFATTNNRFISVFITEQDSNYIISDGGWINNNEYETGALPDNDCYEKIYNHYLSSYDIKQTRDSGDRIIFFKKASKEIMVSSMVFDVANFINTVVSTSSILFVEKKETEARERFRNTANNYIAGIVPKEKLHIREYLDEEKAIKIDVMVNNGSSKLTLLNYITGSTNSYFIGSIYKANTVFGMANSSKYKDHISSRYVIVDDLATGYDTLKIGPTLNYVVAETDTKFINWTARMNLKNILN